MHGENDAVEFPSDLIGDKLWTIHLLEPWTSNDKIPNPEGASHHILVVLAVDEARYTLNEWSFVNGGSLFRYIRKAADYALWKSR